MLTLNFTVAVDQDCCRAVKVDKANFRFNGRRSVDESEFLDPEIADAITSWWLGERPGLQAEVRSPVTPPASLEPFSTKPRELIIAEDSISLLGLEVWRNCGQSDTRDALIMLRQTPAGDFPRIRGAKLAKNLGRHPSNPIGKPLADFRRRCTAVMLEKQIECGNEDVLANGAGGYHFRAWMVVRVVGAWACALGIEPDDQPSEEITVRLSKPVEKTDESLNERQRWILDQVRGGVRLSQKAVLAHFRGTWNSSTIKRDLKALREQGRLKTGADGHYAPSGFHPAVFTP